jgi:hypothetical protein
LTGYWHCPLANSVDYAYREAGDGGVPLVLLQHFRGNLDAWDPALIDALASGRRNEHRLVPASRVPAGVPFSTGLVDKGVRNAGRGCGQGWG